MANKKISELISGTIPLTGTEVLPIVQGGSTVKATVQDIANLAGGGVDELTITGNGTFISPVLSYGYGTLSIRFGGGGQPYPTPNKITSFIAPKYQFQSYTATATELVMETPELAGITFQNLSNVVSLTLPNLTAFFSLYPYFSPGSPETSVIISNNSALTTLSIPNVTSIAESFSMNTSNAYKFNNNALSEASVDGIIDLFYLYAPPSSFGSALDLSGGTNSAPSAAGLTKITDIQSRGWTVYYAALP